MRLDLKWSLGVDGLSMPLVLLTGFITTLATMAAWPVNPEAESCFTSLLLAMYTGQIGVFAVQDMLLFFLFWELELIPVYLLLSIWGGKKRLYAATKFILYTAGGSLFILVAALAMAFYGDTITFDMSLLGGKGLSPANAAIGLRRFFCWPMRSNCRLFPCTPGCPMPMGRQLPPYTCC